MCLNKPQLALTICLVMCMAAKAQDSSKFDKAISFPDKVFGALDKKTSSLEQKLDRQTDKYLDKLQRRENKLRKKLSKKDSTLAKQLFDGVDEKYNQLKSKTAAVTTGKLYSGHCDSLMTTLKFLQTNNIGKGTELGKLSNQYQELQNKLNYSEEVRKYLLHRQQYLKEQFAQLGMVEELKQFRKQVYYYQQQVKEYREVFDDPTKLENKLMGIAKRFPQFQKFFEKNSFVGSFFGSSGNSNISPVSYTGVQTRYAVQQTIASRITTNPSQFVQTQFRSANTKVGSEKQNFELPPFKRNTKDLGFKPNSQRTKSFKNRLEKGANIHFGKLNNYFPAGADIGLTLGYKLNDNSVIGMGTSYKLGLGNSFNTIHLSQQGYTLRSFLDWKIKGSFYAYGGYEKIYLPTIQQLRSTLNQWQESGLLGLSKKYALKGKLNGNMQLLFDFLSYKSLPKREPIIFRFGYNF